MKNPTAPHHQQNLRAQVLSLVHPMKRGEMSLLTILLLLVWFAIPQDVACSAINELRSPPGLRVDHMDRVKDDKNKPSNGGVEIKEIKPNSRHPLREVSRQPDLQDVKQSSVTPLKIALYLFGPMLVGFASNWNLVKMVTTGGLVMFGSRLVFLREILLRFLPVISAQIPANSSLGRFFLKAMSLVLSYLGLPQAGKTEFASPKEGSSVTTKNERPTQRDRQVFIAELLDEASALCDLRDPTTYATRVKSAAKAFQSSKREAKELFPGRSFIDFLNLSSIFIEAANIPNLELGRLPVEEIQWRTKRLRKYVVDNKKQGKPTNGKKRQQRAA